jgi:hypothetical protein
MYAYSVDNQFYYNVYLALRQSWKTGKKIKFYCNDDNHDVYNWEIEPDASLDFLMSDYAHRLRNQNERLILMYSGGTDSHTIYNIFKQNNIHIDEIFVKTEKDSRHLPTTTADWLRKNHWDSTTLITEYDNYDKELKLKQTPNEDWIWSNRADLFMYRIGPTSDGIMEQVNERHGGHSYKVIVGTEKPRLIYRQGKWYHRQMGLCFHQIMGQHDVVPFYMEPLIAIKQSHLVKAGVKELITKNNLPLYDNDWAEAKWPKTPEGYRAWCLATGRHDELTLGVSYAQKVTNESLDQTEFKLTGAWKDLYKTYDHRLHSDLLASNQSAVNYVKGFLNLSSEHGFIDYLKDNGWLRNTDANLRRLSFIWSRERSVGA